MAEKKEHPRLPYRQLTILSICRLAEPIALSSVFPYLPEMIESFEVPKEDVSKWAGIALASFSLSQAVTGIPWGRASDRFGRKPAILCGMFCIMITSILFGFSRTLAWAIVARSLAGASNGYISALRTTVVSEPRSAFRLIGRFLDTAKDCLNGTFPLEESTRNNLREVILTTMFT